MLTPTRPAPAHYRTDGYWEDKTLTSFLVDAASRLPERDALVEGTARFSFRQLADAAARVAAGLQRIGARRHDVITMELPNWWESAVISHASLWGGHVANPVVPIYRRAELTFIMRQARPAIVVVPHVFRDFDYVQMMQEIFADLNYTPTVVVVRPVGELPGGFIAFDELLDTKERTDPVGDPDDICLLLYTSGTTSEAKGALHNHETLLWEIRSINKLMQLDDTTKTFMASPVGHLTGFVYGIILPTTLEQGAVLLDVWDPATAVRVIEAERCSWSLGATPFLRGICDEYEKSGVQSSLTSFLCGGADVPPSLIRHARELLQATVSRSYGSTEMPVYCTSGPEHSAQIAADTDGMPIPPGEGHLIDTVDGVGELVVRGPELFLGYLDAAMNGAAFTEEGYFRTGDLASITDAGAIIIRGRAKDTIIRAGENISAREVEEYILSHAEVADVAVVAMPDPRTGERACAFIVARAEHVPSVAELGDFLVSQGLAKQKCPEMIRSIQELPRNPSGKIQKFILRDLARS